LGGHVRGKAGNVIQVHPAADDRPLQLPLRVGDLALVDLGFPAKDGAVEGLGRVDAADPKLAPRVRTIRHLPFPRHGPSRVRARLLHDARRGFAAVIEPSGGGWVMPAISLLIEIANASGGGR